MAINFERLLKLTADYHNFCNDDLATTNFAAPADELSIEELDFVAAAAKEPVELDEARKK